MREILGREEEGTGSGDEVGGVREQHNSVLTDSLISFDFCLTRCLVVAGGRGTGTTPRGWFVGMCWVGMLRVVRTPSAAHHNVILGSTIIRAISVRSRVVSITARLITPPGLQAALRALILSIFCQYSVNILSIFCQY